jgi:hypothetical protein
MDAAMILVLILGAGVVALLVWFEINSRQNDARQSMKSDPAKSNLETFTNEGQPKFVSKSEEKKAA